VVSHRPPSGRGKWSCGALALCLLVVGCSHYEPIQEPVAQTNELIGYEVRVTTTEGHVLRFVLRDVTESELVGDFHRVRLDKVTEVARRHFDIAKTALLFVGLAGLYFIPMLWEPWM
jgi:hypothetical protein